MRNDTSPVRIGAFVAAVAMVIATLASSSCLVENLDADELMVVQAPVSGELTWHLEPGWKWQGFGKVTKRPKRDIFEFESHIRFNEGGTATLVGSIQYEYPLDVALLNDIHARFPTHGAVEAQIMGVITEKAVYMTGPMMSSKESYSEKRTQLISLIEDQVENGIYQTEQSDIRQVDPLTGEERTVTVAEIVVDENGVPLRQEESTLGRFGLNAFNFAINRVLYDEKVEAQIAQQQDNIMAVQTAIAEAKRAEQDALTVEEQGRANAARAKWEQEVIKARAVTEAEQRREVAELDKEAAEFEKQRQILLGDGEAYRKRVVMEADGALQPKLDALVSIHEQYANAISEYQGNWVPGVVLGGDSTTASAASGATDLTNLLIAKLANDLGIDLSVTGQSRTRGQR